MPITIAKRAPVIEPPGIPCFSRIDPSQRAEFEKLVLRMSRERIHEKRNKLAHGEAIPRELAASLRELVISTMHEPGILRTLVELVDPS